MKANACPHTVRSRSQSNITTAELGVEDFAGTVAPEPVNRHINDQVTVILGLEATALCLLLPLSSECVPPPPGSHCVPNRGPGCGWFASVLLSGLRPALQPRFLQFVALRTARVPWSGAGKEERCDCQP